jgi:hypothetical protein
VLLDGTPCGPTGASSAFNLRQQPLTIPAPNPARFDSVGEVVLALLRCHREKDGGIPLHILASALRTSDVVFVVFA